MEEKNQEKDKFDDDIKNDSLTNKQQEKTNGLVDKVMQKILKIK